MNRFISKFEQGTKYVNVVSRVRSLDLTIAEEVNNDYLAKKCVKFIPASGAATRMFKDLYNFLDQKEMNETTNYFLKHMDKFAFYSDLKNSIDGGLDVSTIDHQIKMISNLLLEEGLNYGGLPKALIKFHTYGGLGVTPIDEHIFEGEKYLNRDKINLHFTISKEHESLFNDYVKEVIKEKALVDITYSFQKNSTNTLAVDLKNQPFKLDDGRVLYRPGGHGALIENLNDIDADIIFIKNIDNVCHRDLVKETIESKKMLASVGYVIKNKVDHYVNKIMKDDFSLAQVSQFITHVLKVTFKEKISKEMALEILNRPLRVCGLVKNQGEPGGGPFVVDNGQYLDFQICETVELDANNTQHMNVLKDSEFFNPVDLVCFVKDYRGEKFDLRAYVNESRYFISEKTYKGRPLKALEHPGLWNGGMHKWNTIFVEVPLVTFNPVKTVNDLLREGHQAKK